MRERCGEFDTVAKKKNRDCTRRDSHRNRRKRPEWLRSHPTVAHVSLRPAVETRSFPPAASALFRASSRADIGRCICASHSACVTHYFDRSTLLHSSLLLSTSTKAFCPVIVARLPNVDRLVRFCIPVVLSVPLLAFSALVKKEPGKRRANPRPPAAVPIDCPHIGGDDEVAQSAFFHLLEASTHPLLHELMPLEKKKPLNHPLLFPQPVPSTLSLILFLTWSATSGSSSLLPSMQAVMASIKTCNFMGG